MPDIWLPSPGPCREDPEAGHHETAATKVELASGYVQVSGRSAAFLPHQLIGKGRWKFYRVDVPPVRDRKEYEEVRFRGVFFFGALDLLSSPLGPSPSHHTGHLDRPGASTHTHGVHPSGGGGMFGPRQWIRNAGFSGATT